VAGAGSRQVAVQAGGEAAVLWGSAHVTPLLAAGVTTALRCYATNTRVAILYADRREDATSGTYYELDTIATDHSATVTRYHTRYAKYTVTLRCLMVAIDIAVIELF